MFIVVMLVVLYFWFEDSRKKEEERKRRNYRGVRVTFDDDIMNLNKDENLTVEEIAKIATYDEGAKYRELEGKGIVKRWNYNHDGFVWDRIDDNPYLYKKGIDYDFEYRECKVCGEMIRVMVFPLTPEVRKAYPKWYCPHCGKMQYVNKFSIAESREINEKVCNKTWDYHSDIVENYNPFENIRYINKNLDENLSLEEKAFLSKNPISIKIEHEKYIKESYFKRNGRIDYRYVSKYFKWLTEEMLKKEDFYIKYANGHYANFPSPRLDIDYRIEYRKCKKCGTLIPVMIWVKNPDVRRAFPTWYCPTCEDEVEVEIVDENEIITGLKKW